MSQLSFDDPDPIVLDDPLRVAIEELIDTYGWTEVDRMVRMQRPSEIHASAPARSTDPETSHLAAKRDQDVGRFSSKSRQAKLLYAFSTVEHGGLTDQQAAARIVGPSAAISAFEGCRRRCSDLRAARYIYDTGKRRKNMGSDEESIVWALSDAGRAALIRLDETGWSR